jgi:hypothetical protein
LIVRTQRGRRTCPHARRDLLMAQPRSTAIPNVPRLSSESGARGASFHLVIEEGQGRGWQHQTYQRLQAKRPCKEPQDAGKMVKPWHQAVPANGSAKGVLSSTQQLIEVGESSCLREESASAIAGDPPLHKRVLCECARTKIQAQTHLFASCLLKALLRSDNKSLRKKSEDDHGCTAARDFALLSPPSFPFSYIGCSLLALLPPHHPVAHPVLTQPPRRI